LQPLNKSANFAAWGYMHLKVAIDLILAELESAIAKHTTWPSDAVHASAILAEEVGELVQATLNFSYSTNTTVECQTEHKTRMISEAMQIGAMALRFIVNAHGLESKTSEFLIDNERIQEEIDTL
jgi:NTP pyrophosphatase (non-canonical NTP hydrolase)